jgi:hypothetical protein
MGSKPEMKARRLPVRKRGKRYQRLLPLCTGSQSGSAAAAGRAAGAGGSGSIRQGSAPGFMDKFFPCLFCLHVACFIIYCNIAIE